jgi:hypothetical protein
VPELRAVSLNIHAQEDVLRILAIDPGPMGSAMVLWDGKEIVEHRMDKNEAVGCFIAILKHDVLAIEMIASYGMPVGKEVFETCVWIGRFVQIAVDFGIHYELIPRREVKLFLCNSVRAKDANVRQALIDKVGPQGKKACPGPTYGIKADEWAALGLALTAHHQEIAGAF